MLYANAIFFLVADWLKMCELLYMKNPDDLY